MLKLLLLWSE